MFSFETGMPEGFTASLGSQLAISAEHARDGKHALRWDYAPGGRLTMKAPIGFVPFVPNETDQRISTFGIWVYSKRPVNGQLVFAFGRGEREDCRFSFGLSFAGWRTARPAFERDMDGTPHPDMDTLTIYAPPDSAGTLYFDQIITSALMDPRYHTRDEQVPFVNVQADQAANRHWIGLQKMKESLERFLEETAADVETASEEEKAGLRTIQQRWDEEMLQRFAGRRAGLAELEKPYRELGIRREGGSIRGRTVDLVHLREFYPEERRDELLQLTNAASIRDVTDLMLSIAVTYRMSERKEEKAALRQWFLDLADHLEDQGWAWGSSQGTVHHLGYQTKSMYPAYYLMREVLREALILERSRRMLEWYSGLGKIADPDDAIEGNADLFHTTLPGMMCALLMRDEEQTAVLLLRRLKRWMELSLLPARGLKAFLKGDGAAVHHVNHYPAYALGAFRGLAPVVRILAGTPFRLPQAAHETVRNALMAMRFYSNKTQWLIGLSCRHPTGAWALDPEVYREMALAGSPDGKERIDRSMAAAYLRLLPEGAENEASKRFREEGIEPEPDPQGHWTMNFACAAFHRRRHWLVGVRGFSRYIWGNETYLDCNLYGRYIAYGHLEIMGSGCPVNHADSGYVPEGWDWNRWPGTTVIHLPFNQLRADVRNVDRFSGFEEMLISDETFAGGLSLKGRNGMFAMKLHEHAKYNGSHRARKSYFFFDERIIALGTDIENDDTEHETETTLFQRHLKRREEPVFTASEGEIREFPYVSVRELTDVYWLMDPQGNGYVLPGGQTLALSRAHQTSPHQKNDAPTEGDFAAAWLSHGRAPQGGAYEFVVLVQTPIEEVQRFAERMNQPEQAPYVVLQKDAQAHIVFDRESRTTGYAWFEAGEAQCAGRIRSVDTPCMIMCQEENGELHLSVADPDLRLYEGVEADQVDEQGRQREVSLYSRTWIHNDGKRHELTLEAEGVWSLKQPDERVRVRHTAAERTLLTIACKDAVPVEFTLI